MLNRPFARYLLAAAAVAAALALHHVLVSALHASLPPYITFYPAVMFTAVVGGFAPGLAATALSALMVDYFILPPVGQFSVDKPADIVGIAIFSFMGVFMSVVAERYRHTREREQMFQAAQRQVELQRLSFDAIVVWRIDDGIESWNLGAEQLYGYSESEALGHVTHELLQSIHPKPWSEIEPELRANGFWEGEIRHRTKQGHEVIVWTRKRLLRGDDGVERVLETNRDVTAHRQAEQRVAHLASFPELNPNPIFEADPDGKISYANPAARKLFPDILQHGANHPLFAEVASAIAEFTTDPEQEIVREVEADGRTFLQTIHYRPELRRVRVYFTDITDRKRAEQQLQRLNRTLQALSNSNQALMHATDEPAFLQQVCRIINEDCGHAMVWIGFAENDENKTVRPVASAGFEEGYLETMRITWADSERGRGPTGTAIRTGQPSICRNMLTDPKFLPWREQALKRGYASSLVVPLKEGDKALGAITIYSRQPDTFSEGEVSLLTELAGDLTYGINTLRGRAARARAEEALRESEERLNLAIQAADFATWDWDVAANKLRWSPRCFELFDLRPGTSVSHQRFLELLHPEDRGRIDEAVRTALEGRKEYDVEMRTIWSDGSSHWISSRGRAYYDSSGRPIRMSGVAMDITDRKRDEEALRQSEERWATTLRSIGDAVISTCAQGKVIFMNDVAQTLTGWTLADAQGNDLETVFNIINEVTREKPENPVAKVLRLSRIVGLANHTALMSRDGTEYPIEDSAAPIRNQDGTTTGVVLVFHDVTEKRKAEQALRQSERLATTGRLAATLAHEIHNPLDTVGNLLFLMDQVPDLETARQYAAMASDEVGRVTQMTRHMLAFQRESSKPVPVNIAEVLDGAIALFERKIQSANLHIQKQVSFEQSFLGLASEIRQVLVNLLSNAIEAVGQNGKISLRAHACHNWHNGQRGLRVTVADNGPGIPDAIRGRIFEPFFTTKGEAGTGLGLWITSGIIEKCGGTLRLRSVTRPGRSGTSFSVFLPIED